MIQIDDGTILDIYIYIHTGNSKPTLGPMMAHVLPFPLYINQSLVVWMIPEVSKSGNTRGGRVSREDEAPARMANVKQTQIR